MLCLHPNLAYIALVFVVVGEGALIFLFYLFYSRAEKSYVAIKDVESDETLFQKYRVDFPMFLVSIFGHFVMMFGVFFLIYSKYVAQGAKACL
jgi:hypothetical protein